MAEKKNAEVKEAETKAKTEKITLFKDNKDYKDDVFVCINGKSLMIQRGEEVEIPEAYANVLKQSMAQDRRTAALMDAEQDKFHEEAVKRK